MLQLEAPSLGITLPTELCARARAAWQAPQQRPLQEHTALTPQLAGVGSGLEALGLRFGLHVFNNYLIDIVIPQVPQLFHMITCDCRDTLSSTS